MASSEALRDHSLAPKSPTTDQTPLLPTLDIFKPFDSTLSNAVGGKLSLVTIPTDIRRLIYNAIIPFGPLIVLQINAHTTLLKHLYALSQTSHFLHDEINLHLTTRPLTILCASDLRPNILSDISSPALSRVETLIIEDHADSEPIWALLPNIKSICFSETYTSTIQPSPDPGPDHKPATTPTNPSSHPITKPDPQDPPIQLTWPMPAALPSTNQVLAHIQRFWQDLRLRHRWIYDLWKRELPRHDSLPRVRILLRRVYEARVIAAVDNDDHSINKVVAWHAVVDVDSRKVVENRHLAVRDATEDEDHDKMLFPYAAQTWWRREPGVRNGA